MVLPGSALLRCWNVVARADLAWLLLALFGVGVGMFNSGRCLDLVQLMFISVRVGTNLLVLGV